MAIALIVTVRAWTTANSPNQSGRPLW